MRFTVYLATISAIMMLPSQTTQLANELAVYGEGEGEGTTVNNAWTDSHVDISLDAEANADADADAGADADTELQAAIRADAKIAADAHAESESLWKSASETMGSWADNVKEGWTSLKKSSRGINLTTVSKMLSDGLKDETAWQSLCHDYSDHVATSKSPLNFEDFFSETTFYHGGGDWLTYESIGKDRGEEPAKDGYITQRKDARNEVVFAKLEELHKQLMTLMGEATEGKKAKTYSDYKLSKLPQGFYDKVVENKGNKNTLGNGPKSEAATTAEAPATKTVVKGGKSGKGGVTKFPKKVKE